MRQGVTGHCDNKSYQQCMEQPPLTSPRTRDTLCVSEQVTKHTIVTSPT